MTDVWQSRSLLPVIDVHHLFVDEYTGHIIDSAGTLVRAFADCGEPVAFTRFVKFTGGVPDGWMRFMSRRLPSFRLVPPPTKQ